MFIEKNLLILLCWNTNAPGMAGNESEMAESTLRNGVSLVAQMVKSLPAVQETQVQSLGRKDPGEGNGSSFHYSCLENSVDRGAWLATVHGLAKSWTPLSD